MQEPPTSPLQPTTTTRILEPTVTRKTTNKRADAARERIAALREKIASIELLCSGTLVERMVKCGKPNCRCATDPSERHGPYHQWGHMRGDTAAHRYVTPEQARVLRQAIDNHRQVKKLLRAWETESERIIDAEHPKEP